MPTSEKCPKCGSDFVPDAGGGNCLRCLFQLALDEDTQPIRPSGDSPNFEQPGDTVSRYKLLQQIGEGGCGVVYLAEQEEPVRRYVAIKVIKLGMDTKSVVARFEAEQQAMALMDHPNIAKVFDAGATTSGRPFFVMELVRGIKITEFCDQHNLSTRERLGLFIQVCNAIQHAHQKGVIHRDIKPSNVLVTKEGGVPTPKVIDFGIAKATQQRLTDKTLFTALEQFMGTPAYMSPEQAEMSAAGIDTRSDIYSLGVLLYELLTGQTPFETAALIQAGVDGIRRIIREREPDAPSTRLSTLVDADLSLVASHRRVEAPKLINMVRGDLDWIVLKALEKDRVLRYETANGMAMDVQRHLNDEPIVARPPGNLYRLQKMFRRNKVAFVGTAAIMAALSIGAVISTWQAVRATRAERTSNQQRALAEEARNRADQETIAARRAADLAEARYLFQERLLPAALSKSTESFRLGGDWEDGLILNNIAATAREHWVLTARLPMNGPVSLACVAGAPESPYLVETGIGGIRVLDALTSEEKSASSAGQAPRNLFPVKGSNMVVAVSDSDVSILALPSLEVFAKKPLKAPIGCVAVEGNYLLLVFTDGEISLFELPGLTKIDSGNWNEIPMAMNEPLPQESCISAGGEIVLFHAGGNRGPIIVWDRRHAPSTFKYTQDRLAQRDFHFYDTTRFASWYAYSGDSDVQSWVHFYDVETNREEIALQSIPHDDIKQAVGFQSWDSREWNWNPSFRMFGFIGVAGLVLKGTGNPPNDFTISERFANLLPTEVDSPKFLAADLARGILILRGRHDLLFFRYNKPPWNRRSLNLHGTACKDGLLYASTSADPSKTTLFFEPFDPHQKSSEFRLKWLSDSMWSLKAVCSTPDVSTVAVIAQEIETASPFATRYGRVRALIYHPGGITSTNTIWSIANSFEINSPSVENRTPCFASLDPEARTLLYWNTATSAAMRYSPNDGKPLGALNMGHVAARSRDGQRVASITSAGRLDVYDLSSGKTLLELADKHVSAMCFSTDGSFLATAQANDLTTIDVASGHTLTSIHSQLLPLAYPNHGNRFLAFQPDTSGTGGSIVLADTADARVSDVITRAGSISTPAFFSDSGDQIALMKNWANAEVIRLLKPDELSDLLNADLLNPATKQPPITASANAPTQIPNLQMPQVESASNKTSGILRVDDIASLISLIGKQVTVEGKVGAVTFTSAGNAMHLEFPGTDERKLLVWVPQNTFPKLMEVLGKDAGELLRDKNVRITGRLDNYDGRHAAWRDFLQITLNDASNLTLCDTAGVNAKAIAMASNQISSDTKSKTNVMKADDVTALAAQLGRDVTAEGRVLDVRYVLSGSAMSIEFEGPDENQLLTWVPQSAYAELEKRFGQNPGQALKDQVIRVSGKLGYYGGKSSTWKGHMEINLSEASKLTLVSALAASSLPAAQEGMRHEWNHDTNILNAEDVPLVLPHLNQEVTLEGRVADVKLTLGSDAMNVIFAAPDQQGLLAYVPRAPFSRLGDVLGKDPVASLTNHILRVTGRITYYGGKAEAFKGRVQITLKDPAKFLIMSGAGDSPATPKTKERTEN